MWPVPGLEFFSLLKYYISFQKTLPSKGRGHWVLLLQFDKTSRNPLAKKKREVNDTSAVKPLVMRDVGI